MPSAERRVPGPTSEEMWDAGGRYGSIDPCYPSKVAQAHIQNLLMGPASRKAKLDYLFFPCITHLPSFVAGTRTPPRARSSPARRRSCAPRSPRKSTSSRVRGHRVRRRRVHAHRADCYFRWQMFETWGERLRRHRRRERLRRRPGVGGATALRRGDAASRPRIARESSSARTGSASSCSAAPTTTTRA